MSNIKIHNLSFSYGNKDIFKNINYSLEEGKSLSIIGTCASGKTTLLKLLNGQYKYKGKILIDDLLVNESKELKNKVFVIFKDTQFINDIVIDELKNELAGVLEFDEINNRIKELNTFFNLSKIFKKKISDLNYQDQVLLKILSFAIGKPKYLIIDDLLSILNTRDKILLLNYLNSNDITLINVTSDLEDVIYTDNVLCLYDGVIAIEGPTFEVLNNEKILKRLGLELPFYFDISIQLKLYGLIDRVVLNKEDMVKELWK